MWPETPGCSLLLPQIGDLLTRRQMMHFFLGISSLDFISIQLRQNGGRNTFIVRWEKCGRGIGVLTLISI
ncbi:hypothetical protein LINGRAHAP2_LOCUS3124, partial [Linum grandiflorum]